MVHTINGTGATAGAFTDAMQNLTLRHDLQCLTLMTWRHVLSTRGLLRPYRAWCPKCIGSADNSSAKYERLIWCLAVVEICGTHNFRLVTICPFCNRTQPVLTSRTLSGYCSYCFQFLADHSNETAQVTVPNDDYLAKQIWVVRQLGQLFSAGPSLMNLPKRSDVARSIDQLVTRTRSESAFARAVGLPQPRVNEWRKGRALPSLKSLLTICMSCDIPLIDLIRGTLLNHLNANPTTIKSHRRNSDIRPRSLWTPSQLESVQNTLTLLTHNEPPLPLVEIARLIGRPPSSLYWRFHGLCQRAALHYKQYQELQREERLLAASATLEPVITKTRTLSVQRLAMDLRCSASALKRKHPSLTKLLAAERFRRRLARWQTAEALILQSIGSGAPSNLRQIATQLGCNHASLYIRFPNLCKRLAAQRQKVKEEQRLQRRFAIWEAVQQTALTLFARGDYPSIRRVSESVTTVSNLRSNPVALQALREIRAQLSLD
jgi:transcriptional regulator with XRE-family HTH domain